MSRSLGWHGVASVLVCVVLTASCLSPVRGEGKDDKAALEDPFFFKCTQDEEGKVDTRCVDLKMVFLSGGGFMRLRDHIRIIPGVKKVNIGYTGGFKKNFTYEQVCIGGTGHTEVVQVFYDSTLSFEQLLNHFFDNHDATHRDHIGNLIGWHYRSAVFYRNPHQLEVFKRVKAARDKENADPVHPIVTDIEKFDGTFYQETAEDHELWDARRRAEKRVEEYKRALGKPDDQINAELKKNYDSPSFTHLSEELIEKTINKTRDDAEAKILREEKEREEELHQAEERAKAEERARTLPPPYKDKDGNWVHYGTPNPNEIDIVAENDKKAQKEEKERLERIKKKMEWDQVNLHKKGPKPTPAPPTPVPTKEPTDTPLPEEVRVRLEAPVGKEEEAVKAYRERKAKEAKNPTKKPDVPQEDEGAAHMKGGALKVQPPPPVKKSEQVDGNKPAEQKKSEAKKSDAKKSEAKNPAPQKDDDKQPVPKKQETAKKPNLPPPKKVAEKAAGDED
jgi:peptide-methionine (S)-S-oxide reductase